ncbi:unnamed protein product, partial [Adineta ricciae]
MHRTSNDVMPDYLSSKTELFDQHMSPYLAHVNRITMADLRDIAFLTHYFDFYTLLHQLWTNYFKAGTGQLHHDDHIFFWSDNIQSTVGIEGNYDDTLLSATTTTTTTNKRMISKEQQS